jgi:hypothetical protein
MKKAFIILFLAAVLLFPGTANAQQITLTMSPPIVETLIKPGKTILIGYTVQNLGDPTTLEFKVRPFAPQGDQGGMSIEEDLVSPIRFTLDNSDMELEKPFLIRQKESRQAVIRMRVPEGTPEGDYYFVVLATSHPIPAVGGTTSGLAKATIGSTLLMTVTRSGKLETKGRIALFDIVPDYTLKLFGRSYKIVESTKKIPLSLIVQNQGKNVVKPQGEITLRSPVGGKTAVPVTPQNILSESQRQMKLPPLSGYFVGSYTLSARVHFGEGTPQLFANVNFIGLPVKLIVSVFFVAILSIFLILLSKRKHM